MGGIFQFFSSLLAKISAFAQWLILAFKQVFVDIWNMFTDLVCWLFEGLLGIATAALDSINIPFDPQTYYALIPAQTANMLGYIGLPQAIGIVVSGLLIRFFLQTIPFVRWGS